MTQIQLQTKHVNISWFKFQNNELGMQTSLLTVAESDMDLMSVKEEAKNYSADTRDVVQESRIFLPVKRWKLYSIPALQRKNHSA